MWGIDVVKSFIIAIGISLALLALIVGVAFIPKEMVPEGQYRDALVEIQGYLPFERVEEKVKVQPQTLKVTKQAADGEISSKHSSYSADDIEKAKRELLAKKRQERVQGTNATKSILEQKQSPLPKKEQVGEQSHIFLIELYSGSQIYTKNLKTGDGEITYETDSGLLISLASNEVKSVQKLKLINMNIDKTAEDK